MTPDSLHHAVMDAPAERSTRLAFVLPVAASSLFLEKIEADYDSRRLGAETSFSFPAEAPAAIETEDDARAAEAGVRDAVVAAAAEGADAVLVTCFSDPGVRSAAREVGVPVLGEGRPSIAATGAILARSAS